MLSISSFTVGSGDFGFSWLTDFFLKLYFSSIFPIKHLMVSILTNILSPGLIGWDAWNYSVPPGHILLLFLLLQNFLVYLFPL